MKRITLLTLMIGFSLAVASCFDTGHLYSSPNPVWNVMCGKKKEQQNWKY